MSEPKKPEQGSEVPPDLSPKEQAQQDTDRVQGQLVVTDVTRQMQGVMEVFGFGGSGSSGRTSFEGHELNAMIDLIENSNPEHLEEAGTALLKARSSLNDAAKELGDFIGQVDWEGDSGTAFREWGNGLVSHAYKLGEFAQTAGTQITVAGTGLASVRSSLPPRDSRLIRKSPDDIESPARIEGNPEYAAAVKVEKDRQEAINQANRLASYYAVSEETLAAQEPPRFDKKLDVAMPRPQGDGRRLDGEQGSSPSSGSQASGSADSGGVTRQTVIGGPSSSGTDHGLQDTVVGSVPDRSTSTEINSVAAPPTPVSASGVSTPLPPANSAASGGSPTPPMAPGIVYPVASSSRGLPGAVGAPRALGQAGNSAAMGNGSGAGGSTATGRGGSPVGRPSPMNGGSASGSAGRAGGGTQSPNASRSGITGGRPTATGRAGTPGASAPRAGRASGIVGGTPQRVTPGAVGGGRNISRGTAVGAEGTTRAGSATGGIGQRGVVGATGANSASRSAGRGTTSTKGVLGTPRGGPVRPGAGSKGFTVGGTGLVRGPAGRQGSDDEEQDDGTPRPDYLTEDRETWEVGRRDAAPPVIE